MMAWGIDHKIGQRKKLMRAGKGPAKEGRQKMQYAKGYKDESANETTRASNPKPHPPEAHRHEARGTRCRMDPHTPGNMRLTPYSKTPTLCRSFPHYTLASLFSSIVSSFLAHAGT